MSGIETWLMDKVLNTEHLYGSVQKTCSEN